MEFIPKKNTKLYIVLLVIVFIIAILLRVLYLGKIPPGIHPDAAINALDAWCAFTTHHYQVFYEANFGREGLFINLVSFSFGLFGPTLVAYKLPGALIGIISVLGMYVFGIVAGRRQLVGLFAAFFMAISMWMILFERTGLRATVSVACVIWTSTFFILALRHRRWYWYALTGLFLGLGLYTYISFRLIPLMLLAAFFYYAWLRRKVTKASFLITWHNHHGAVWTIFVATIVALPLGLYFFHHPEYIMSRANEVSILSQPHPLALLAKSTLANLSIFSFYGDPNWRHAIARQPLLDPLQSILFIMGIILVLRQVRKIQKTSKSGGVVDATIGVYILILFGGMILPAATTYSPGGIPHALRIINTAPAVYMFIAITAAMMFEWFWQKFVTKRRQIVLVTGAIFVLMTTVTAVSYFSSRWGQNEQIAHEYSQDYTNVSAHIKEWAQVGNRVYLVNTSNEVRFFTIATPNILQSSSLQLSDISSYNPDFIVITTNQASDQQYINGLREKNWSDVGGLNLGEGGHPIIVLRKP